ncbi:hypothetical protein [Foetidibacter luteolus]|uniref:hypothetical protein n=1 Tax=Foetidibacter luteolus TaxID=2608880 RepID=UPI00129A647B|nr:hypothetical protein [Foetidibacter luteolus]
METNDLKIIGYWHSLFEPSLPDPAWFVDNSWDQTVKERILYHLRNGVRTPVIHLGSSWCRFRCGKDVLGSKEFTDGKFVWPVGLEHYVDYHNIRLPQEIVDWVWSPNKKSISEISEDSFFNIDYSWWKNQKGWNTSGKSYRDLLDVGSLTITQIERSKKDRQLILLKDFLFKAQEVSQKLRQIKKIVAGETVTIKGRFTGYELFKLKATAAGLQTTFEEMTYADYRQF